jgi:Fe-S cluster assembly protein SufD
VNPFDAVAVARVSAGEPPWRAQQRAAAFDHFGKLSMPDPAEELWRYVEFDFALDDFALVDQPAEPGAELANLAATHTITVVDGFVATAPDGASDRVWLGSLANAPEVVQVAMQDASAVGVPDNTDVFSAAHGAFGPDATVVHVGRGADSGLVVVDVHAATPHAVTFPRIVVLAEEAATASVVVNFASTGGVDTLVVPRLEVVAGNASNVKISVVQDLARTSRSIAHARAVVGRDANLVLAEAGIGARLSRLHLTVDLEGQGSSAKVLGAYFGDRDQVLDYRYFMHHAGLNTRSDMFLKGAVEDEALSVFTGMIRIDESAQRTDAFQTNRNLILSEGAAAQSVPNLEILANDVRCGHGSTVGPLDDEQRYYLMSRGLDPERADRLQVRGFFQEALNRFPHAGLVEPLGTRINAKFVEAQEEGRV